MDKPETLIAFVQDRPGHDRRYAISPAKTQAAPVWHPAVDFSAGLAAFIAGYLANRKR